MKKGIKDEKAPTAEQHTVSKVYQKYFCKKDSSFFTICNIVDTQDGNGNHIYKLSYDSQGTPEKFSKKWYLYETDDIDGNILENHNMVENFFCNIENDYHTQMKPFFDIEKIDTKDIPQESIDYMYKFFAKLAIRTTSYVNLITNISTILTRGQNYISTEQSDNIGHIVGKKAYTQYVTSDNIENTFKNFFNKITILIAPPSKQFYTGDVPVVPYIRLSGTKMIFSISPHIAIQIKHSQFESINKKHIKEKIVDKINENIIVTANEGFVVTNFSDTEKEFCEKAFKLKKNFKKRVKNLNDEKHTATIIYLFCRKRWKDMEIFMKENKFTFIEKTTYRLLIFVMKFSSMKKLKS